MLGNPQKIDSIKYFFSPESIITFLLKHFKYSFHKNDVFRYLELNNFPQFFRTLTPSQNFHDVLLCSFCAPNFPSNLK